MTHRIGLSATLLLVLISGCTHGSDDPVAQDSQDRLEVLPGEVQPVPPEFGDGTCVQPVTGPRLKSNIGNKPWHSPTSKVTGANTFAFCSHANHVDEGVGRWLSYSVYLPEGYDHERPDGYPVVYWLHGTNQPGGGDFVVPLVEQMLAANAIEPVIYIFPNGGSVGKADQGEPLPFPEVETWKDAWSADGEPYAFQLAFWELFDHVEAIYNVSHDRRSRGIEGFSKGGANAARFALVPPYHFSTAAPLAGGYKWEWTNSPDNDAWDFARDYALLAERPDLDMNIKVGDADFTRGFNEWFSDYLNMTRPNFGCVVNLPQQDCLGSWLDPQWLPNQPMNIAPIAHVFEVVSDASCSDGLCQNIPVDHDSKKMYDLRGEELVLWHQQNLP